MKKTSCKESQVEETLGKNEEVLAGSYVQQAHGFQMHEHLSSMYLGSKEMNDRMIYLEQVCCCDVTLSGLPKSTSNCPVTLPMI